MLSLCQLVQHEFPWKLHHHIETVFRDTALVLTKIHHPIPRMFADYSQVMAKTSFNEGAAARASTPTPSRALDTPGPMGYDKNGESHLEPSILIQPQCHFCRKSGKGMSPNIEKQY